MEPGTGAPALGDPEESSTRPRRAGRVCSEFQTERAACRHRGAGRPNAASRGLGPRGPSLRRSSRNTPAPARCDPGSYDRARLPRRADRSCERSTTSCHRAQCRSRSALGSTSPPFSPTRSGERPCIWRALRRGRRGRPASMPQAAGTDGRPDRRAATRPCRLQWRQPTTR